jgi:hypothetical protein
MPNDQRLLEFQANYRLSTRFRPRWVGWLAIASGAGPALSRISWTSWIWLPPYLLFWLWVITVAVLLLRRNFRGVARSG